MYKQRDFKQAERYAPALQESVLNHMNRKSCLLDAEAEVEQAVGGVWLSVGSFHLIDEATETIAQFSSGALKNILLQLHETSFKR